MTDNNTPSLVEQRGYCNGTAEASTLVDRLRGHYRIPITDGHGPAGGEEPDNPSEFVKTMDFQPPIQLAAADRIQALEAALKMMVDDWCDYTIINDLGNPEKMHVIKAARQALSSAT